jgi:hypothetical protein
MGIARRGTGPRSTRSRRVTAPPVSPTFRAAVRERVRHAKRTLWPDLLPDVVHFASCGLMTGLALVWLPLSAPVTLGVAAVGTLLAHVVLTAAHDWLDTAEEAAS